MMMSPQTYYETNIKGQSPEKVLREIETLLSDIAQQKRILSNTYGTAEYTMPSPETILQTDRDYLEVAYKAYRALNREWPQNLRKNAKQELVTVRIEKKLAEWSEDLKEADNPDEYDPRKTILAQYYGEDALQAPCHYTLDQNRVPVLVKPDGHVITFTEKTRSPYKERQATQGWKRAILFMQYKAWHDGSSMAATMSASLAYGPDQSGKCYIFSSAPQAEEYIYPTLSPIDVKYCRQNVDTFYSIPALQRLWQKIILHPVCLSLTKDGTIKPVDISWLDMDLLLARDTVVTFPFLNEEVKERLFREREW